MKFVVVNLNILNEFFKFHNFFQKYSSISIFYLYFDKIRTSVNIVNCFSMLIICICPYLKFSFLFMLFSFLMCRNDLELWQRETLESKIFYKYIRKKLFNILILGYRYIQHLLLPQEILSQKFQTTKIV